MNESSALNFTSIETEVADEILPTNFPIRRILAYEVLKCARLMDVLPRPDDGGLYCPRLFDGWSCWNDTPAGEVAYIPCPYFIVGFDASRLAHKFCSPDGTWFRHPDTNKTWSNYTACVNYEDLYVQKIVTNIFVAGYSISMAALVVSLFIFCHFRSLRCTRIRIHKNLFSSFIVNNALWIIWYKEVVDKTNHVVISNKMWCQMLHILVHYSMLASYFWMFCEGIYLHTLLVIAFVSEEKIMRWFYLVGWFAPALVVAVYGGVRGTSSDEATHCWMNESDYMWILTAPVCFSLFTNFIFLINIVRVLVTKLRANNFASDANGTRKAVKATLILIPLLGLHYVLTPFRPDKGSPYESAYHIFSAIVSSSQGFFVALLFCFFNSEVISAMRKKWIQFQFLHERKRTNSCSTAYAFSFGQNHSLPLHRQLSKNKNKNRVVLATTLANNNVKDRLAESPKVQGISLLNMNGVRQADIPDFVYDMEEKLENTVAGSCRQLIPNDKEVNSHLGLNSSYNDLNSKSLASENSLLMEDDSNNFTKDTT